jgi:hypothetical protein
VGYLVVMVHCMHVLRNCDVYKALDSCKGRCAKYFVRRKRWIGQIAYECCSLRCGICGGGRLDCAGVGFPGC